MSVQIDDNTGKVVATLDRAITKALHEVCGELVTQIQRNTRVAPKNGGQTKASFSYYVEENEGTVGSPLENAIWEEFGTGEHALHGDGRKDVPWKYKDDYGKWHTTSGKRPSRAMYNAIKKNKNKLIRHIESVIKGGMK